MSKLNCSKCGRSDFKSPHGLKVHEAKCTLQEELEETSDLVVDTTGSVAKSSITIDKEMDHKMKSIIKHLNAQEKVSFYIPDVDGLGSKGTDTVQINGYTIQVTVGSQVKLPQQVADMFALKYNVQQEAGKDMLANRDDKVLDALS